MWPLVRVRSATGGLRATCRTGRCPLVAAAAARPLSNNTGFDVRDQRIREYLCGLRALLSRNDSSLFGKVSGVNFQRLQLTARLYEQVEKLSDDIASLEQLKKEVLENEEKEMADMAGKDLESCEQKLSQLSDEICAALAPIELVDTGEVLMEFGAGVGGQEAMLFSRDLMNMYSQFARVTMGWQVQVAEEDLTDSGGLRFGTLSIAGANAGRMLKLEGGVHRVQRVPKTERGGRIHTSTATVAILPCPNEVDIEIDPKDIIVKAKRSTGPGGQHVNKTESAVQICHIPTGIIVESGSERHQLVNKSIAMMKLRAKLFDIKVSKEMSTINSQRKLQVGSAGRSEKIRTYNFTQGRVTDHRLPYTVHNLDEFLQGGAPLKQMIDLLQDTYRKEQVTELINNKIYF